jgi:hypothetical protein
MTLIIKKQAPIELIERESGDIEIKSTLDFLGDQSIFLAPENAILLANALVELANEMLKKDALFDQEHLENQ